MNDQSTNYSYSILQLPTYSRQMYQQIKKWLVSKAIDGKGTKATNFLMSIPIILQLRQLQLLEYVINLQQPELKELQYVIEDCEESCKKQIFEKQIHQFMKTTSTLFCTFFAKLLKGGNSNEEYLKRIPYSLQQFHLNSAQFLLHFLHKCKITKEQQTAFNHYFKLQKRAFQDFRQHHYRALSNNGKRMKMAQQIKEEDHLKLYQEALQKLQQQSNLNKKSKMLPPKQNQNKKRLVTPKKYSR